MSNKDTFNLVAALILMICAIVMFVDHWLISGEQHSELIGWLMLIYAKLIADGES